MQNLIEFFLILNEFKLVQIVRLYLTEDTVFVHPVGHPKLIDLILLLACPARINSGFILGEHYFSRSVDGHKSESIDRSFHIFQTILLNKSLLVYFLDAY